MLEEELIHDEGIGEYVILLFLLLLGITHEFIILGKVKNVIFYGYFSFLSVTHEKRIINELNLGLWFSH